MEAKKSNFLTRHFKKCWMEYVSVVAVIGLIFLALFTGYKLWNMDISIPLKYDGGDDISAAVNAKMLLQQNWALSTDRLGTPIGADFFDFSANLMHNTGLLVMKFFVILSGNAFTALNLTFLSIFFMTGLISYFVMRELKISNWISVLASATFGVSPFMLMRGIEHIVLTECYFLPLSVLLCVWIYERDDVFAFDKTFFKNPRNYLAIFFMFLIANNGIAYYPFFTCFMLVVTAISKLAKTGKFRYVFKAMLATASICVFVVLSMLPGLIYSWTNGANPAAIVRGGFAESELYGLKIIQLFIPVSNHGSSLLDKLITNYNENTWFLNENMTSYIGLLGIVGFIVLMIVLFIKKDSKVKERLGFLSELNIMLVLLGTTSGFGTIFSLLISDKIRGYNRISILISYVCILSAAIALDALYKRYKDDAAKKVKKYAVVVIGGLFGLLCVFETFPDGYVPEYDITKANFTSDKEFVERIESEVPEASMIYQLPYHEYPEGGEVNNMADYHLFIGFIHSEKLKWSYGSIKGRESDVWNYDMSQLDTETMVDALKASGFAGIYVDRRAYEEDELTDLESTLSKKIGVTPIESNNGNLSFFKF